MSQKNPGVEIDRDICTYSLYIFWFYSSEVRYFISNLPGYEYFSTLNFSILRTPDNFANLKPAAQLRLNPGRWDEWFSVTPFISRIEKLSAVVRSRPMIGTYRQNVAGRIRRVSFACKLRLRLRH